MMQTLVRKSEAGPEILHFYQASTWCLFSLPINTSSSKETEDINKWWLHGRSICFKFNQDKIEGRWGKRRESVDWFKALDHFSHVPNYCCAKISENRICNLHQHIQSPIELCLLPSSPILYPITTVEKAHRSSEVKAIYP